MLLLPKKRLIKEFELSPIQAQAILDLRLHRLTGLERDKIKAGAQGDTGEDRKT